MIATEHVRSTVPVKPPVALTPIAEMADPPGVLIVAVVGFAVIVKFGTVVTVKLT